MSWVVSIRSNLQTEPGKTKRMNEEELEMEENKGIEGSLLLYSNVHKWLNRRKLSEPTITGTYLVSPYLTKLV